MGLGSHHPSDALPTGLVVRHCALRLDGGTIQVMGTDETGRWFSVMLVTALHTGTSPGVAGRLYFDGKLVPMRSDQEAQILRLLSEAAVEVRPLPLARPVARTVIIGEDIKDFFQQTPEENCRAFIRKIVESVRSEDYVRFATDEERAIAEESSHDVWERPSGKKKQRSWRRR
jgi:hypothetical protein